MVGNGERVLGFRSCDYGCGCRWIVVGRRKNKGRGLLVGSIDNDSVLSAVVALSLISRTVEGRVKELEWLRVAPFLSFYIWASGQSEKGWPGSH